MARPSTQSARRRRLLEMLTSTTKPIPGDKLSEQLGVSRQAIVQDIAVLRSSGVDIVATSRGYLLASSLRPRAHRAELVVRHGGEDTERELTALVDLGVRVVDVVVEHEVYGEIRANLLLSSRADVREFIEKIGSGGSHLLSVLTDGRHTHTIEAPSPELLERAKDEMRRLGFMLDSGPERSGQATQSESAGSGS